MKISCVLMQAAKAAAENSPVVPAAAGVQVPNLTSCAFSTPQQPGQQLPVMQAQATPLFAAQQLQQQCLMQQQALLHHQVAPQMPLKPEHTLHQAPQQAPAFEGTGMQMDAPDIFSDMPLDELPVDVQPGRQVRLVTGTTNPHCKRDTIAELGMQCLLVSTPLTPPGVCHGGGRCTNEWVAHGNIHAINISLTVLNIPSSQDAVAQVQEAKRSWEQPPVDVHKLSSFWDGPPPGASQSPNSLQFITCDLQHHIWSVALTLDLKKTPVEVPDGPHTS